MAPTLSSFKNAISSCFWLSTRISAWRGGFLSALFSLVVIEIWTDISLLQRNLSESRQYILSFGIMGKPLPLKIIIFWKRQDWPSEEKAWAMGKFESKYKSFISQLVFPVSIKHAILVSCRDRSMISRFTVSQADTILCYQCYWINTYHK